MKNIILLSAVVCLYSTIVFSNENHSFNYDEQRIEKEFNGLNELEKYYKTNPDKEYDKVIEMFEEEYQIHINKNNHSIALTKADDALQLILGILAGLVGCCLLSILAFYILILSFASVF
jgi:hypothetical protein